MKKKIISYYKEEFLPYFETRSLRFKMARSETGKLISANMSIEEYLP